jgi:uncharacterized integral membrane protein (TIGR00697 family)
MNQRQKNAISSYFIFFVMLYFICISLGYIFSNKEIHFPFLGTSSPGALILPLAFTITDIIAEVYGYDVARRIIWLGLIAQGFFFLVGTGLAYLPDPGSNFSAYTSASNYQNIFGILPRTFLFASIGYLIGIFVNTYLITKWKILLKGRYFWLRSIGASSIGEFIFTFIGVFLISIGRFPINSIIEFIMASFLIKLISSIIYAYPANFIATICKKINANKWSDSHVDFNPFRKFSD